MTVIRNWNYQTAWNTAILVPMTVTGHVLPFPQAPDGIELRHLRAFVAVAEELSFGRAAERLYVSQSALSRQISGLEQLVQCKLLRTSTHRVELTLAGAALLDRARRLLTDVDQAVSAAQVVGGEHLAHVVRLLDPMVGLVTRDAGMQAARDALEDLNAHFSVPPGTTVRPVTADGVPSLLVSPASGSAATVLYLHGGGYMLGSAFGYQPHAGALATAAQTGVLVPDYRLAPEHPFPAAVEDALRAYRWMTDQRVAPKDVTIAGDSSGGGLALSMLIRLKQAGIPLPGTVVLFCPWVDLAGRISDRAAQAGPPLASGDEARSCVAAYTAGHPLDDPVLDPLSADLNGFPRMLIQAATGDAWIADAKALAAHALACGVDVRLELFPVDAHAFQLFWSFLPEAADAMEAAGLFIRQDRSGNEAIPFDSNDTVAPRVG